MYRQRHKIPAFSSFKRTQAAGAAKASSSTDAAVAVRSERKRPATTRATSDATAAFSVAVREGDSEKQFIVLASDIVSATKSAVNAAAKRGGEIVRVAYLAETLTA